MHSGSGELRAQLTLLMQPSIKEEKSELGTEQNQRGSYQGLWSCEMKPRTMAMATHSPVIAEVNWRN